MRKPWNYTTTTNAWSQWRDVNSNINTNDNLRKQKNRKQESIKEMFTSVM